MTELVQICERWPMQLETPTEGDEWFLNWVLRAPSGASHHITAGWHAYTAVSEFFDGTDKIKTAREWFGGMGAHSLIIQGLLKPETHLVSDYSPSAVKHLKTVLEPFQGASAVQMDAYQDLGHRRYDLVGVDCGDGTVWRTRDDEPYRKLLDKVFERSPEAVVLTDIACRYLHLHRERYETLLGAGTCVDYPTYLRALASRLEELYGYSLLTGFWDRWSAVFVMVPYYGPEPLGEFKETPHSPIGIEIF